MLVMHSRPTKMSHTLVVGVEDTKAQVFEAANAANQFPFEDGGQMTAVARRLCALAENLSADEFRKMFKPDEWWQGE